MRADGAGQVASGAEPAAEIGTLAAPHRLRDQRVGHHQPFADFGEAAFGDRVDPVDAVDRCSGPKAIARLPGMVQGVVVQITTEAPASAGWLALTTGNFTQIWVETVVVIFDLGFGQRRSSRPPTT